MDTTNLKFWKRFNNGTWVVMLDTKTGKLHLFSTVPAPKEENPTMTWNKKPLYYVHEYNR